MSHCPVNSMLSIKIKKRKEKIGEEEEKTNYTQYLPYSNMIKNNYKRVHLRIHILTKNL